MRESQRIEWKETWHNEYMRHICAFANSQGGSLFIGIKDDGTVVGVNKSKKLLEDIPNKAVQLLGITVAGELRWREEKPVVEILVPQSSVPVSLHGRFYVRSGSTVQELHGHELRDFILRKENTTWDEGAVSSASMRDLDESLIMRFAGKAALENRLPYDAASDDPEAILRKLDLLGDDGKLTRAAVLLFGKRPRKFVRSALVTRLRNKYLRSTIVFEGLERKEKLEVPEKALREAVLNAIVHRDYGVDSDITISVYDDRVVVWNFGALLAPLNVEMLKREHPSRRRNSLVAEVFFRAGHIEAWGRGIARMVGECIRAGLPEPRIEEFAGGIRVSLFRDLDRKLEKSREKSKEKSKEKILQAMLKNPRITIRELAELLNLSTAGIEKNIKALKEARRLKRQGSARAGRWEVIER